MWEGGSTYRQDSDLAPRTGLLTWLLREALAVEHWGALKRQSLCVVSTQEKVLEIGVNWYL